MLAQVVAEVKVCREPVSGKATQPSWPVSVESLCNLTRVRGKRSIIDEHCTAKKAWSILRERRVITDRTWRRRDVIKNPKGRSAGAVAESYDIPEMRLAGKVPGDKNVRFVAGFIS